MQQEEIANSESAKEKKKPKLPRRPRIRDWPIKVYAFHCEIVGDLPEWVSRVEEHMRSCWNDMAGQLKRSVIPLREKSDISSEDLKALQRETVKPFKQLDFLRAIATQYKGMLPSDCYYIVADRFQKTMQEWPQRRARSWATKGPVVWETGMPRIKYAYVATDLSIPVVLNRSAGKEITFADLYDENLLVSLWRLPEASSGGYNATFKIKTPQGSTEVIAPIKLLVAIHRLPPMNAIVKRVSLVRKRNNPFPPVWSLQFSLELPPSARTRKSTGRQAGLELGDYRKFEDRIRLGVLSDNDGFSYEVSLPFDIANRWARKEREYITLQGKEYDKLHNLLQLVEIDEEIGKTIQRCKDKLKEIYQMEGDKWPEEAKAIMTGINKMRQRGLRSLSELLTGIDSNALGVLSEWEDRYKKLVLKKRVFQISAEAAKSDAYRQIAAWIAQQFDVVAWEGDLSLKKMAERPKSDYALKKAQRYRQLAGQSKLRLYIEHACEKYGCELQNRERAYVKRSCSQCGAIVEKGPDLFLVCENGHKQDRDVGDSRSLLNTIGGVVRASTQPIDIPAHLKRYLRLMTASETEIVLIENQ